MRGKLGHQLAAAAAEASIEHCCRWHTRWPFCNSLKGRSLYSLLLIGDPKWYNFLIVILAMTTTTMPFSHSNLVKVAAESQQPQPQRRRHQHWPCLQLRIGVVESKEHVCWMGGKWNAFLSFIWRLVVNQMIRNTVIYRCSMFCLVPAIIHSI